MIFAESLFWKSNTILFTCYCAHCILQWWAPWSSNIPTSALFNWCFFVHWEPLFLVLVFFYLKKFLLGKSKTIIVTEELDWSEFYGIVFYGLAFYDLGFYCYSALILTLFCYPIGSFISGWKNKIHKMGLYWYLLYRSNFVKNILYNC